MLVFFITAAIRYNFIETGFIYSMNTFDFNNKFYCDFISDVNKTNYVALSHERLISGVPLSLPVNFDMTG